jgi:hypothetical protein
MFRMLRSRSVVVSQLVGDCGQKMAYTSMFRATSWPFGELLRALKVSRRLTGRRDEPGMLGVS